MATEHKHREANAQIFKQPLPITGPKINRPLIHKSNIAKSWCIRFIGADKFVAERSQLYLYENQNKDPVQIELYFQLPLVLTNKNESNIGFGFRFCHFYLFLVRSCFCSECY